MNNFIIPDGQATGCNPRTTRVGDYCSRLEDKVDIITDDAIFKEHIEADPMTTLLKCVRTIHNQGRVGSCATHSSTAAIELVREFNGQKHVPLSAESLYAFTSGGRDQGSSIDENLRRLQEVGVLTLDTWPQDDHRWSEKPPADLLRSEACYHRIDEWYDVTDIQQIMTCLVLNYPVVFGWQGHSCVLLCLASLTEAFYLNSWGNWSDTGMPGIGRIKLRAINSQYGMFAVRSTTDSGIIVPDPSFANAG